MMLTRPAGALGSWLIRFASGLVAVSAAFGVVAVLTGGFGETEGKILGTALLVAAGVFAVLVAAAPGSRSWRRLASLIAMGGSPFGAAGLILLIWIDSWPGFGIRIVLTIVTVSLGALAVRLIASLNVGPSRERYAAATSALGAVLTLVIVNFAWEGPHGEIVVRWFAAGVVVFGAAVLLLALGVGRPTPPVAKASTVDGLAEERELVDRLGRACSERGVTIAVAESLTAGALQASLGRRPGATRFFEGGLVAYAPTVKVKLLGVDPSDIEGADAVSEAVARQMASGVRDLFDVDIGIAVTGWSEGDPDRLVFYPRAAMAIAGPGHQIGTAWVVGAGESRDEMIHRVVVEALRATLELVTADRTPNDH